MCLFLRGRIAQLVQSACLTSRMSGVQIPLRPQKALISGLFSFTLIPTSLRAILNFIPNFLPFFSPDKRSGTCLACFSWKMLFFHAVGWSNCFTHCCTRFPSALPRSSFIASPMTLPISLGPSAPAC